MLIDTHYIGGKNYYASVVITVETALDTHENSIFEKKKEINKRTNKIILAGVSYPTATQTTDSVKTSTKSCRIIDRV